jgi:hypothetical protein
MRRRSEAGTDGSLQLPLHDLPGLHRRRLLGHDGRSGVPGCRENEDWINYQKYKKFRFPPPNLSRGRCRKCGKPFIETWGFGRNHVLLFVRAARFERPELLPAPETHMFYEHRVRDIDDGIPKHEGYFASEWAMAKMIVHAMSNGREF